MRKQMKDIRIFAPAGMLGYGIHEESFNIGIAVNPHTIVIDAGSTDESPTILAPA